MLSLIHAYVAYVRLQAPPDRPKQTNYPHESNERPHRVLGRLPRAANHLQVSGPCLMRSACPSCHQASTRTASEDVGAEIGILLVGVPVLPVACRMSPGVLATLKTLAGVSVMRDEASSYGRSHDNPRNLEMRPLNSPPRARHTAGCACGRRSSARASAQPQNVLHKGGLSRSFAQCARCTCRNQCQPGVLLLMHPLQKLVSEVDS